MAGTRIFTEKDCTETGYGISLKGKVVVVSQHVLTGGSGNQLAFCVGGEGARPNPKGRSVFLVDLQEGDRVRRDRSHIVGVLKPELLTDLAKLQLSQIRPIGALSLKEHAPLYSGYSFLEDGRYAAGVWLCSEKEVADYVEMQKPYQHRIMICDRNDFCVLEVVKGQPVYPDKETLKQARKQKEMPGMDIT